MEEREGCAASSAYEKYTVQQLKERLRDFGCTVRGNKAELINRLATQERAVGYDEDDSDDDDYEQQLEVALDHDNQLYGPDADVQNEDEEFDYTDVSWMGIQQRVAAVLPPHIEIDPLCRLLIDNVTKSFRVQFIGSQQQGDVPISAAAAAVFKHQRRAASQKVYLNFGTLFFLYIFFFTEEPVNIRSALFTWDNCASFLKHYVTMPKRPTARGTAGLRVPSMGMLNKCAFVLNGMFKREKEAFHQLLFDYKFKGRDKFFLEPTENGRPAVSHNTEWREHFKKHGQNLKQMVQNNSLPNNEVVKAATRATDDELGAMAQYIMGLGGLANTRTATLIGINLVAIARTGEATQFRNKDIRHCTLQTGTSAENLYGYPATSGGAAATPATPRPAGYGAHSPTRLALLA